MARETKIHFVPVRFYKLTSSGDKGQRFRWLVTPSWSIELEQRLRTCRSLEQWNVPVVRCRRPKYFEDMPWSLDGNLIVSDPLRQFLEASTPNVSQFLPVSMNGPGLEALPHGYWVVNVLRCLPCVDKSRSLTEDRFHDRPYIDQLVIDPTRIPEGDRFGRVAGDMTQTIMRGDLCQAIVDAGFRGPQFWHLWHSNDGDAPPADWPQRNRRTGRAR